MPLIQIKDLCFTYEGSYTPVFTNFSVNLDTDWRVGLVGRNGRGKTTLLKLLMRQLQGTGTISALQRFDYFPYEVDETQPALVSLRNAIALFDDWAAQMDMLLATGTPEDLQRWGELEHLFAQNGGYEMDELLQREIEKMGIDHTLLSRPFNTFSPGERTRMKIAALFLRKEGYLLIDEPTDHLDAAGRTVLANYLNTKKSFILVSHDRWFLDAVVDHIIALQKTGAAVIQGNYSVYRENKELRDAFELEENERLLSEIDRLDESRKQKATWSDRVEATKIGTHSGDRGRVGHLAAKAMKRSLSIQTRIERKIEERQALLHDIEYASQLLLHPLVHPAKTLMHVQDVSAAYDGHTVFEHKTFTVAQGDRIALQGKNGGGKSTMIRLLLGEQEPVVGNITRVGQLVFSYMPQMVGSVSGTPFDIARENNLQLDYFLMLLRKIDFRREAFERDIASFSLGQQKKVLLAAAMAKPAHIYIWDEPLNYIDLESREQIEDMLLQSAATIIFVEHDQRFTSAVATKTVVFP